MKVKKWTKHQWTKCLQRRFQYLVILVSFIGIFLAGFIVNEIRPDCMMIQHPSESDEYLKSLKLDDCGIIPPIIKLSTGIIFTLCVAVVQTSVNPINLNIQSNKK